MRSVSGGGDLLSQSGAPFSRHDLKNMVKLESAVTEMNRLTTAPMVPRRALKDTTLELRSGTYRFDAGHDLALFPPTTHLDPEIYEDPYDFRFDRFLPDSSGAPARFWKDGQRVHFNLLPFGAGVSMCPGRFFAINEFKIAVAVLLSCFDIELLTTAVPKQDVSRTGFGTLPPVDDVPFRYRRRLRRSWRSLGKEGHAGEWPCSPRSPTPT
ncbi:MAG: cytochrome P450 [Sandaracinaceae bacterium]|nr:cytochrome P450 [Sandaracinaceae bacterium]